MNRKALIDAANPQNLLGTDRFGNSWFAETRADGRQIWAQVRNGKVTNGGINTSPRIFDLASLSANQAR